MLGEEREDSILSVTKGGEKSKGEKGGDWEKPAVVSSDN